MTSFRLAGSLLLLLPALTACSSDTAIDLDYTVGGTVYFEGERLPGAWATLDGNARLPVTTDADGNFEFAGVPRGPHNLVVSRETDWGRFVQRSTFFMLVQDVRFDELVLPAAVSMAPPAAATATSLTLTWTVGDTASFAEYRVYRSVTPDLNESTGTLLGTAFDPADTTWTDATLAPGQEYYFRVYAAGGGGRLSGSNIVSAATPPPR